jgi:hypothetical protein
LKAKYGFQQWQDIGHSGDIFRNKGADGNSSGGSNKQEKEELSSSLSFLSITFSSSSSLRDAIIFAFTLSMIFKFSFR